MLSFFFKVRGRHGRVTLTPQSVQEVRAPNTSFLFGAPTPREDLQGKVTLP